MLVVHEESYKGIGFTALIHRNRLRQFLKVFKQVVPSKSSTLADYGCSNGYVISLLQREILAGGDYRLYGFDHSAELLQMARDKQIPGAVFHYFDLNKINKEWEDTFNIIISLETLEHVGDYRNALENLYKSCKDGGIIIISIPNENGVLGILKYFMRKILRENPYREFFQNKSEFKYLQHLFLNKPIDVFREPGTNGWGSHLGFDWKKFREYLENNYINRHKLEYLVKKSSFLYFNFFYVLRKLC